MTWFEALAFPIYLKHVSEKSYLKLSNSTQYVSLFSFNTGEDYFYQLIRTSVPSDRLEKIYNDADFVKINEAEFLQQMKTYLDFHDKLKSFIK